MQDGRRAVAVEDGRDDAAVEEAEAVVVLGPRQEHRAHLAIDRIAAQPQALVVVGTAPEARRPGEQPLLDADLVHARTLGHAAPEGSPVDA